MARRATYTEPISALITKEAREAIDEEAEVREVSISEVIRELLDEGLAVRKAQ